ncbi:MAG: electron transfer flavoprotein subunit alpha/FixB family protein [Solirubrobacteraceae bacterium]
MSDGSDILTFSERADVGAELLAVGRQLAQGSGLRVVSLVVGDEGAARAGEEIARGADEVVVVAGESPPPVDPAVFVQVLAEVIATMQPRIVLVGSTRVGAEVAARLAQRLGVASASECLALELDEAGDLVVERFVYGGRFVTKRVLRSTPKIAAVQLRRFEPRPRDEKRQGEVREAPVPLSPAVLEVVERKQPERSQVDIGKAEVIVAAGRGVKTQEDLALLESLARALGGELAGSRPLVEMLWIPRDRQVGLSGQTVKPKLYVACGVSGQIEHIAGMRPARTVVAINTNPDAPIFQEADYCITGDLYEVVPALIRALEEGRARVSGTAPGHPDTPDSTNGSLSEVS